MPTLPKSTQEKIKEIAHPLTLVLNRIALFRTFIIPENGGKRLIEKQNELHAIGVSKIDPMKSKHVPKNDKNEYDPSGLSEAVDIVPTFGGKIDWRTDRELWIAIRSGNMDEARDILENIKRWYEFNGYVQGTADQMGIPLRSGHDWDKDGEFDDQTFHDLPHKEYIKRRYE